MKLKNIFKIFIFLFLTYLHLEGMPRGPVFSRNQMLNQLIFFQFYPMKAEIINNNFGLITDLAHSNVIRLRLENNYTTWSDMEISQLTINPIIKINKQVELSLNAGAISYWGGFLDQPVESFHKIFNFPNGQRKYTEKNDTKFQLGTYESKIIDRDKPTSSLRDTSLILRYQIIKRDNENYFNDFALSVAAGIEFPTGKLSYGTSNGATEYGIATYIEKGFLNSDLYIYYLASLIKPGTFKNNSFEMKLKPFKTQHSLSFELFSKRMVSLITQLDYASSPYQKTGNKFIDVDPLILIVGLNLFKSGKTYWQISFTEDMTHKTTPDFTAQITHVKVF